ncbi:MAG: LPS export ABC transporter permease LptG [Gammaproteobacteria bacterium]|nr:LPS export ABC transporter permease LptG [Gammaproteobacteria bacterium]
MIGRGAMRLGRIDRYLGIELFRGYAVVACVLLALFSLMAFIEELDDVGDGVYNVASALAYVIMTTPSRVLRLLPFITLFGGSLAIWQLARRSELVILRAAGMSLRRLAWSTMLPGLVLVVAVPLVYEFVAPALYQGATMSRETAIGGEGRVGQGFWSRSGDVVIEVGALEYGRVPVDIRIYRLGPDAGLRSVMEATSADPQEDGSWRLHGAEQRVFYPDRVEREMLEFDVWRPWWADDTPLHPPPVDSLSFSDLRGYIDYLEATGQPRQRWELAYWRMWLLPVSALLMGLLAVPIALMGPREGEFKFVGLAAAGGLFYYLGDQVVANAVLVSGASPLMAALAPPLALAVVVAYILKRLD